MPIDHEYRTKAEIKRDIESCRRKRLRQERRKQMSWERMKAAYAAKRRGVAHPNPKTSVICQP